MIICGLKLTHDASVALIEDDQLVFSIELEKLNNNERYTLMEDTTAISKILQDNGYKLDDVDHFAIDGWGGFNAESLALQTQFDERSYTLRVGNEGAPHQLAIADYEEPSLTHDVLEAWTREGLRIGEQSFPYSTYLHVVGHLMSAYCTSPFAAQGESSYILMWDGGTYPRLYYFDATTKQIANLGPLFLLIGDIYRIFARHFGPFEGAIGMEQEDLSIAGKVMAYIALGTVRQELFSTFNAVYDGVKPKGLARPFSREVKRRVADGNYPAADILRSLHAYLEKMLVSTLSQKVLEDDIKVRNICLTGGCALNIKWNSAIRSTGIFNQVYVPPFPNDSGNAIGAACAAMFQKTGNTALQWNVYNGPNIINNQPADGWQGQQCSIDALARILYEHDEPVVFLNERAELGPRALGNRSILASAFSAAMKEVLNRVKQRESYRPVSPICLEEKAPAIFEPGNRDPYMLFDHKMKPEWREKLPAVCHLDGTARLQTINQHDNEIVANLLVAYEKLSDIAVLCNTSANYKGSGFFPDVYSATDWGAENGVHYVWCNQMLYTHNGFLASST